MFDRRRIALTAITAAMILPLSLPWAAAAQQEIVQSTVSLGSERARLQLELADGRVFEVTLADGRVSINGSTAARYRRGAELENEWRELLRRVSDDPQAFAASWSRFAGERFQGTDAEAARAIRAALDPFAAGLAATTPAESVDLALPDAVADQDAPLGEIVRDGLIVELAEIEGAVQTLGRLVPGLPRELTDALDGPMRIVVEASEYRLPAGARLDRSLLLVDTDAMLEGTVLGDVIVADGSLRIGPEARVEGNVLSLDARVVDEGGTITGSLRDIDKVVESTRSRVPPVRVDVQRRDRSIFHHLGRGIGSLIETLVIFLIWLFLGALVVYFFRRYLENVSDTVTSSFGRSFLSGLAAEILFFPVLLVLIVLVLTWLAIPFYIVGFGVAAFLGYLAVAHAVGENLTRRRFTSWPARLRRSNSYYYILNGLAVLVALFAAAAVTEMGGPLLGWAHGLLHAAGWILTWVALTVGLGAVLLSRAGTRRTFARPREIPDIGTESFDPTAPAAGAS